MLKNTDETIKALIPKIKITIKNLGNIFLRNFEAFSASSVVKTTGATIAV
jgi:hypothetical protein